MSTFYVPNALLGENLRLEKDIYIEINENGIIQKISKESLEEPSIEFPPNFLLIPGFINPHTHVGDAFLKDQGYGKTLDEVVGTEGLKHKKLNASSTEELETSIVNSLNLLVSNGYTSFLDCREGGISGVNLLKRLLLNFPLRGLILGRPFGNDDINEIFHSGNGFSFSDVFSINETIANQANQLKNSLPFSLLSIHVSENEEIVSRSYSKFNQRDIPLALDLLDLNFVVHATYANEEDLDLLKKKDVGVISCPQSNMYFGSSFPPIEQVLEKDIILGLGTDNVMISNPNPFRLMAFTLNAARSFEQNITPKEILKAITVNPGIIFGKKIGQIEEGFSADFVGINLANQNVLYSKDVYTAITLRAGVTDIFFQMLKGKIIKWKDQR